MFVVAIEGFSSLITDGSTSAVLTAWAATEWTSAIAGLQLMGGYEQRFEPWEPSLEPGIIQFGVMDASGAGSDTFGTAIFNRGGGVETFLEASIDSDDTTIQAKRVNEFTAATSTMFIDTECIEYNAKSTAATPDTFTASKRGLYAPFKASSETQQRFGREHRLPLVADGVYLLPRITQTCREFRGKWVGIWAHRNVAGTLDTRAQAQCIFAGKIKDWSDTENGMTVVTCEDAKATIRDCTLLHRQWNAEIAEQIILSEGMVFDAHDRVNATDYNADPLTVITGASGVNQIEPGAYSLSEFASLLNAWLASEQAATNLGHAWNYSFNDQTGSAKFHFDDGHATENRATFIVNEQARPILKAMGFDETEELAGGQAEWNGVSSDYPLKGKAARIAVPSFLDTDITVQNVRGEFVDNEAFLPGPGIVGTGTFGVVQFNEQQAAVFKSVDADTIRFQAKNFAADSKTGFPFDHSAGIYVPYGEELPKVRQVVLLYGDYGDVLTAILASTGTASYNGTSDTLASQLGAAIPWEILGTNWTTSLASLTASDAGCSLWIEKPTRLLDAIGVDLVVRMATIVWKDQCLRIASWGTPATALSTVTLSTSNKGGDPNAKDSQATVAQATDRFLVNILKLKTQQRADGTWRRTDSIEHPASINAVGPKAKTCELRNVSTTDGLEEIRNALLQTIELFARPLYTIRRTVNLAYFEAVAPGDFCTVTDTNARDPATGTRGITSKPGLIVGHRRDFGGYEIDSRGRRQARCELDVLLLPLSNISTYSPAADITSYDSGTKVATCAANSYSTTADSPDTDVEYFEIGDKVLVLERDPDDPAAAEATSDTIAARGTNTLTLTTGFTAGAGKSYVIISDTYATAVTTQKADVFQADDTDGMVADTVAAYGYGWSPSQAGPAASYTDSVQAVELYSTNLYGDGKPLDTHGERVASRLCNSLVNARTAPHFSSMSRSIKQIASGVRGIVDLLPLFFGPGDLLAGDRSITIDAFVRRSANGAEEFLYATLCREPPIGTGFLITDMDAPEYQLVGPLSETVSWGVTTTTWAMDGQKTISIRAANPDSGLAWLVVEAEANVQSRGVTGYLNDYEEA